MERWEKNIKALADKNEVLADKIRQMITENQTGHVHRSAPPSLSL